MLFNPKDSNVDETSFVLKLIQSLPKFKENAVDSAIVEKIWDFMNEKLLSSLMSIPLQTRQLDSRESLKLVNVDDVGLDQCGQEDEEEGYRIKPSKLLEIIQDCLAHADARIVSLGWRIFGKCYFQLALFSQGLPPKRSCHALRLQIFHGLIQDLLLSTTNETTSTISGINNGSYAQFKALSLIFSNVGAYTADFSPTLLNQTTITACKSESIFLDLLQLLKPERLLQIVKNGLHSNSLTVLEPLRDILELLIILPEREGFAHPKEGRTCSSQKILAYCQIVIAGFKSQVIDILGNLTTTSFSPHVSEVYLFNSIEVLSFLASSKSEALIMDDKMLLACFSFLLNNQQQGNRILSGKVFEILTEFAFQHSRHPTPSMEPAAEVDTQRLGLWKILVWFLHQDQCDFSNSLSSLFIVFAFVDYYHSNSNENSIPLVAKPELQVPSIQECCDLVKSILVSCGGGAGVIQPNSNFVVSFIISKLSTSSRRQSSLLISQACRLFGTCCCTLKSPQWKMIFIELFDFLNDIYFVSLNSKGYQYLLEGCWSLCQEESLEKNVALIQFTSNLLKNQSPQFNFKCHELCCHIMSKLSRKNEEILFFGEYLQEKLVGDESWQVVDLYIHTLSLVPFFNDTLFSTVLNLSKKGGHLYIRLSALSYLDSKHSIFSQGQVQLLGITLHSLLLEEIDTLVLVATLKILINHSALHHVLEEGILKSLLNNEEYEVRNYTLNLISALLSTESPFDLSETFAYVEFMLKDPSRTVKKQLASLILKIRGEEGLVEDLNVQWQREVNAQELMEKCDQDQLYQDIFSLDLELLMHGVVDEESTFLCCYDC